MTVATVYGSMVEMIVQQRLLNQDVYNVVHFSNDIDYIGNQGELWNIENNKELFINWWANNLLQHQHSDLMLVGINFSVYKQWTWGATSNIVTKDFLYNFFDIIFSPGTNPSIAEPCPSFNAVAIRKRGVVASKYSRGAIRLPGLAEDMVVKQNLEPAYKNALQATLDTMHNPVLVTDESLGTANFYPVVESRAFNFTPNVTDDNVGAGQSFRVAQFLAKDVVTSQVSRKQPGVIG